MFIRENGQGLARTGLNDCHRLDTNVHYRRLESRHTRRRSNMSELDDRFERGQETRRMFGGRADQRRVVAGRAAYT